MMRKLLTFIICALMITAAFADWEVVKAPQEYMSPGSATALNATSVLAVDDNIVLKTTNFGVNWTEIELPSDADLNQIDAVNDTVVFAASDDGLIYKSTDAGESWLQIGDTANFTMDMNVIDAIDENTIFVGADDGLFFKSTDGGIRWDTTLVAADEEDMDGGVVFSSATNGIIFPDGNVGIIWSTTDGGDTWDTFEMSMPFGLTFKRMYSGATVPGSSTYVVVGYHNTIWVSTDGGATFTNVGDYSYGYDRHEYVTCIDDDNFIVFSGDSDMITTSDGGTSWDTTSIGTGQSFGAAAFTSMSNGIIFANDGQWKSTTDGSSFTNLNAWPAVSFWGIGFPEPGKVMLSGWGGGEMSTSTDGGETFSYPDNYASKTVENIYELEFIDASTGILGGGYGMIKKTTDGGATWTAIDNPMAEESNKHVNAMHIADDGTILAGGSSGLIMKSTDDGDTWNLVGNSGSKTVYDIHVLSNGKAIAVMSSGQFSVCESTTLDSFALVADYGYQSFRSVDERNGVVLVAGYDDWVYRTTTDALDTLEQVYNEPSGEGFYDITFVDDTTAYVVGRGGKIHMSTDAGLTWTEQTSGIGDVTLQKIKGNGDKLFAVGQDGVVLSLELPKYEVTIHCDMSYSIRRGEYDPATGVLDVMGSFNSWSSGVAMTDDDADSIYTASLGEHPAGTVLEFKCRRNAAWDDTEEFPSGGSNRTWTVVAGENDVPVFVYNDDTFVSTVNVPAVYALEQNYPNPFNPMTTIDFAVPQSGRVSLAVYNITGQKIANLVNADFEAGSYSCAFDASSFSSGIYFYKMTAGDFVSVRKMTLMK